MRLAGIATMAVALIALTGALAMAQVSEPAQVNPGTGAPNVETPRAGAPSATPPNVGTPATGTPGFSAQTQGTGTQTPGGGAGQNPDAWRMKFENGFWWYWTPENRWVVWFNNQWVPYDQFATMQGTTTGQAYSSYYGGSSADSCESGYGYYPSYGGYGAGYGDYGAGYGGYGGGYGGYGGYGAGYGGYGGGYGGVGRAYNPGGIGGPASGVGVRPGVGAGGLGPRR